jgi:hypothetical protein
MSFESAELATETPGEAGWLRIRTVNGWRPSANFAHL